MKRTTVYAEESDLAILKATATRRGVAEAELIREAIHLAAMAGRTWAEPFFTHTYESAQDDAVCPHADEALDDVWAEKAAAYERTKSSSQ